MLHRIRYRIRDRYVYRLESRPILTVVIGMLVIPLVLGCRSVWE
jgi:hypothetical protein